MSDRGGRGSTELSKAQLPSYGRWLMPLGQPARVERMGVGVHGASPTERFHIAGLWSLHLYRYSGELHVIGQEDTLPIRPGYAGITPPDLDVEYRFREPSVHLWAHLAIDRHPGAATPVTEVPAMADLGSSFTSWWAHWNQVLSTWPDRQPAAAFAWHLLWALADILHRPNASTDDTDAARARYRHPAVSQALEIVETRLSEPLRVGDIAHEVGLSHNQLTRVFRAATGVTPLAYIRSRRIDQAVHLLTRSTRPIKSIAAEVGIPDLQAFNKAIRAATGRPPRAYRS